MRQFDYHRPATLAAALAAGAAPGAAWLGGGTNLVDLMKLGVAAPAHLVDLRDVAELHGIAALPDGGVRIGAMVRNAALAGDDGLAARFPAVVEAVLSGASGQIRNAATLGGNLVQRTRCAAFQDAASACNRRAPGSGCAAQAAGETQALLGWSAQCIATHPSDLAVALVAHDAVVELAGPGGRRELPLEEVLRLPGEEPARETALAPGELILAVRLPGSAAGFAGHARYLKLRSRTSFAFALVSAAAALRLAGPLVAEARIVLGGVAARPWRARQAEALLVGREPGPQSFAAAAAAALAEARPSGAGGEARIELARRVVARSLAFAAAGTPAPRPALPGSVFAPLTGATAHV